MTLSKSRHPVLARASLGAGAGTSPRAPTAARDLGGCSCSDLSARSSDPTLGHAEMCFAGAGPACARPLWSLKLTKPGLAVFLSRQESGIN